MADEHAKSEAHGKGGGRSGGGGDHGGGGNHGGGHEEPHEGAPEWLISFADNVTLMMGFFVIMLAMNMGPKGGAPSSASGADAGKDKPAESSPEMLDLVIAIREAFNNPVTINSPNPRELPLVQRLIQRGQDRPPADGPNGRARTMQSLRPSEYYHLCGSIPFDDESAVMSTAARDTFDEIARHLRGLKVIVEIRGHVSAAEAYHAGDRGMKLSFDRAMAVAQALADGGLEWRQLRVISSGDSDRVKAPAYDTAAQRQNQRVEVVVTDNLMPAPPAADESALPAPPEPPEPPTRPASPAPAATPAKPAGERAAHAPAAPPAKH